MIYSRYYYSTLSLRDKEVYKLIYEAIEDHRAKVEVPLPDESIIDIIKFINLDNPHIYYAELTKCCYYDMGDVLEIHLEYFYSKDEIEELNKKVNKVFYKMSLRTAGKTDLEKVRAVHDLLVENVSYDRQSLANLDKYYTVSNSILGVLFFKKAVCEGISKVVKMLLNILDVKCIVAEGFSVKENGAHAWNIVKIDGIPYHLDVTWDINLSEKGCTRYDYFCLTDREIRSDHRFGHVYPVCVGKDGEKFRDAEVCISDFCGFENRIIEEKKRGASDFIFRYVGEGEDFEDALEEMMNRAEKTGQLAGGHWSFNGDQQVCAICF